MSVSMTRTSAVVLLALTSGCSDPGEDLGGGPRPSSSGSSAAPSDAGGASSSEASPPTTATFDAGSRSSDADSSTPKPPGPPGQVRGLVGVGYGGIRITSRDGGKTWTRTAVEANGGLDDYNLLRAIAYANGTWLATGWGATMSTDGVSWTPLRRINKPAPGGVTWNGASLCGLTEGLASDGDAFYVACGSPSQVFRSTDAINWTSIGTIGDLGGHPALAFREGMFYAYGDLNTSYRSSDGRSWTQAPGLVQATFCEGTWKSRTACHDASWFEGAYFQGVWQSRVSRSTTGTSFSVVHDDPSNNTLYQARAIAEGWVAP
jgi:hypothetical protein